MLIDALGASWSSRHRLAVLLSIAACWLPIAAAAQDSTPPRIGLVIANAAYAQAGESLPGARRDGRTVKDALEQVGFRVTLVVDATKPQMEASIKAFQRALRDAGPTAVGLIYYAGHGSADSARSDNYLLPVDIDSIASPEIASRGLGVRWITDLLRLGDPRPAVAVVIDACRSVAPEPGRGAASPRGSAARAMHMIEPDELPDRGYLVAFSTSQGLVASDSGHFAEALAAKLVSRGLTLDQVFEQVRQDVATRTKQLPTFRSTLVAKVCLGGCEAAARTDALAVLKAAIAERGVGDVGQIAAIQQLTRDGRSLAGFDLQGLHLKGGGLAKVDFSAAELQGANLDEAKLQDANLARAQLGLATLRGTQATRIDARETRMYLVDATGADFSQAQAERSNWRAATLRGASFRGARLQGASFMLADLREADFRGADLRGTFFIGAWLTGARFDDAQLANSDFGDAVGDAKMFTPAQQAALCATESGRGSRMRLVRVARSARYASGKEFETLLDEFFYLGRGLSLLERCAPRSVLPAGADTVTGHEREEVSAEMSLHLPAELLDKVDRERQFVERLKATAAQLNAARKDGPWVKVRGARHASLLAALQRNVGQVKLESSAVFDGEAFTLFQLRLDPEGIADEHWRPMAMQWVEREAHRLANQPSGLFNQWPPFFPPGTSPTELAPEHVDTFKRWTLNRARAFPNRVALISAHLAQVRHALVQLQPPTDGEAAVLRPLRAYVLDTGGAPQVPPPMAALLERPATYLLGVRNSGGWSHGGAVIRLPRPLDSYEMRVSRRAIEQARNDSPGLRLTLEMRAMRTLRTGANTLAVLDADIIDMQLLGADGQAIP